jgi:L-threonylcarbamoyladenylate synthase
VSRTRIGTDVSYAAGLLREGGLVAIPTETVYGLAADATNPAAVARVFEVKQRPWFDPLIVHVPDLGAVERWSGTPLAGPLRLLGERFWPGPLTLIVPRGTAIAELATAGLPTMAVRVPDHPLTRALLEAAGLPLAAPSANPFGRLSPTTAGDVAAMLGGRIDYILEGGACRIGVESTIVACTPQLTLLRPGGVPLEEIAEAAGIPPEDVVRAQTPGETGNSAAAVGAAGALPAPGMLPRHYAPRTPLAIVEDWDAFFGGEVPRPLRYGILAFERNPAAGLSHGGPEAVEVLSPAGSLREAAAAFFAALRRLDARALDRILAEPFPEQGLGAALNDRLRRAAS